jgi:hypothetical protein
MSYPVDEHTHEIDRLMREGIAEANRVLRERLGRKPIAIEVRDYLNERDNK